MTADGDKKKRRKIPRRYEVRVKINKPKPRTPHTSDSQK